jgi:hypothetical protein
MSKLLQFAAALAVTTSGVAFAEPPLKVDLKGNQNVTKVDVKAPSTGSIKVMDNPGNTKVKVQVPETGKVQVKVPKP